MSIPLFRVRMAPEARERVAQVLTPAADGSLYVGQGPLCDEFERAFGAVIGAPQPPLLLNSCTSAIDLALHLCGIGHAQYLPVVRPFDRALVGDVVLADEPWEVISTPITCTATNSPVVTRGARLVWADCDPLTGIIDPADVARKVTSRTRAVIAVNWGGRPFDRALLDVGVPIIEDAAHGPYGDNAGEFVCFSFQAIKHLTTGDGGALLAPRNQHERAKLLRWYGLSRTSSADFRCAQNITEVGFKLGSNDIAAAIGLANLPGLPAAVNRCRVNAAFYCAALADLPGITVPPYDPTSAYWLMTILVEDRAGFSTFLGERGIATSQVHARNDKHTAFNAVSTGWPLPGVDYFDAHQVAIPNHFAVTDSEREYIADVIQRWARRAA